jgi:mannose-6-phosphate isomerase-like protein (cupin superfamily)
MRVSRCKPAPPVRYQSATLPTGAAPVADYTVFQAGPMTSWADHTFTKPEFGLTRPGCQFLKGPLGLLGAEVSVNVFAPGQQMPMSHRHKANEELYLFLSGTGEMLLDGKVIPLTPGTCVRCSPRVARDWRNGGTEPLVFVVVQYPQAADVPTAFDDGEVASDPWPG